MSRPAIVDRICDAVFAAAIRAESYRQRLHLLARSAQRAPGGRKRRLLALPNVRGWAFDDLSQQRARHMDASWTTDIRYLLERPAVDRQAYDLMFNPNWAYDAYDAMFHGRYVRGMNSLKWERARLPYRELRRSLSGAVACFVPNRAQYDRIRRVFPATRLVPEGVDTDVFHWLRDRSGDSLVVGWSGKQTNGKKRLDTVIKPACAQAGVELRIASVPTREELNLFYNDVDLVLIASEPLYEGNPLSLFEAGACGRTVLTTRVGCVPEIVTDRASGLIVDATFDADRTVRDFVDRLRWCKEHVADIRAMGKRHRENVLRERTLERTCESFRKAIEWAYARAR